MNGVTLFIAALALILVIGVIIFLIFEGFFIGTQGVVGPRGPPGTIDTNPFSVGGSGNDVIINTGNMAVVKFPSKFYDNGDLYNLTTGELLIRNAGIYTFNVSLAISSIQGDPSQIILELLQNGTIVADITNEITMSATQNVLILTINYDRNVSVDDKITIQVRNNTLGNITIVFDALRSYFQGFRISN